MSFKVIDNHKKRGGKLHHAGCRLLFLTNYLINYSKWII